MTDLTDLRDDGHHIAKNTIEALEDGHRLADAVRRMRDMTSYARVRLNIWTKLSELHVDEMVMANYVIINPHRKTEGLYFLPEEYAAADLQWTVEGVHNAMCSLVYFGLCYYDEEARCVLLHEDDLTQWPATDKQLQGAMNAVADLPPTRLWAQWLTVVERHCPALATRLREAYPDRIGIAYGWDCGCDAG